MAFESIPVENTIEILNIEPCDNPLISKCQIKVCYVQDEPNRNGSIITKEAAKKMAPSLRGTPIVGYYNENNEDFEAHNKIAIINNKVTFQDMTKPYGFVDLNAKIWFQKYEDEDGVEREYLVTEGWLWTSQYEECQRIINEGNNQSMELDETTLDASWTKDKNGLPQFFIINDANISKLCILGEDFEPCFEGANITNNTEFSLNKEFMTTLYSMYEEIKKITKNQKGAEEVNITTYAVEIGDRLFSLIWEYLREKYPNPKDSWCSAYALDGIYEDGEQKFAIVKCKKTNSLFKLGFTLTEEDGVTFAEDLESVKADFIPVELQNQFSLEKIEKFEVEYKKKNEKEEDNNTSDDSNNKKDDSEGETSDDSKTEEGDDSSDDSKEDDKKKKKNKEFSLEDYEELLEKFNTLENSFNEIQEKVSSLETENNSLKEFKANKDKEEKEKMIESFYMLSDEDKADVKEHINEYSLEDIEAKLSILCVRNKVSFDNKEEEPTTVTTYSLDNDDAEDDTPAWVKAVCQVAKNME